MSIGFMYILECSDGSFYTGSTKDIERRLAEHQGISQDNGHRVLTESSEHQPGHRVTTEPSEHQPGHRVTTESSEHQSGHRVTTESSEHQSGHRVTTESSYRDDRGANYTKKRRPVKLVYYEEYSRIDEAFYREKQVQGWSRKKKLALIEGKPELLPQLAKKIFRKTKVASIRG